jgi:beta-lactamase regulating signal transducer with metallopeptidase domain
VISGSSVAPLLIACGVRASFPVSIAWVVTRLLSRSSAATRHFTWACAISIAAFLPIMTVAMPHWSVSTPAPLTRLASPVHIEPVQSAQSSIATTELIGPDAMVKPNGRRPGGFTPWEIVTWIWITGAAGILCYLLMGHIAAWRFYRNTRRMQTPWIEEAERLARELRISRTLCFVESAQVSVPLVLYLWRPIIVIPEAAAEWPWGRIRAVLLHELAHIKRKDAHIQTLVQMACAAYWFNPLVWFAAHQLRRERERACDDSVLMAGTSGADYATHLYEIARASTALFSAPFAIGLAVHRSQLEQRLVAILNPRTQRHSATVLGRVMVALPVLFVGLAAGAIQITARAIDVPARAKRIPAAVMRDGPAAELISANEPKAETRPAPTEANSDGTSAPGEFHWSAVMREHQTVEVRIARGSIRIVPSEDHAVRLDAQTDDPRSGKIQAAATPGGMKFCSVLTTVHGARNDCEASEETSQDQDNPPRTDIVLHVPDGLHVAGSTLRGDITAEHPAGDIDMATQDGDVTLQLAAEEGANFSGNVIDGSINSDFPLEDNTPPLPPGIKPVSNAPRIVHATLGAGGPRVAAVVINGNIRLLRR